MTTKEAIAAVKAKFPDAQCCEFTHLFTLKPNGIKCFRVTNTEDGWLYSLGPMRASRSQAWKAVAEAIVKDPLSASTPLSSFDLDKLPF